GGSRPHLLTQAQLRREHGGEGRRRDRRCERRPGVPEYEVGEPGGVVHAGEHGPRPGDAGSALLAELPDLRQELRDRERRGGEGQVIEEQGHRARMTCPGAAMFVTSPPAGHRSSIFLLMDAVDRKILAELEVNGRLTLTELADRVRLSLSACQRRLRRLE